MKSIFTTIAVVILALSALTESATELWMRPPLGGSVASDLTFVAPPVNNPLIRPGRRGTIRYENRAPFLVPLAGRVGLDLNADGTNDLSFGGGAAMTASLPGSMWMWFDISGTGSNQFLVVSNSALVQPYGATSPDVSWSAVGDLVNLTTFYSGQDPFWTGSFGRQGIGYLGVRFQARDGFHYGWVRVRLPGSSPTGFDNGQPAVLDWAYETQPGIPIRAGAIASGRGVKEFFVSFQNPDGTPHTDHGHFSYSSCFLAGNILRYEMHVAGRFTNATLLGNSMFLHSGRTLFSRLDYPRINIHLPCHWQQDPQTQLWSLTDCEGELTVFFGDVKLTALQMALLQRGRLCFNVGGGAASGRFLTLSAEEQTILIEVERERSHDPGGPGLPPLPPTTLTPQTPQTPQ